MYDKGKSGASMPAPPPLTVQSICDVLDQRRPARNDGLPFATSLSTLATTVAEAYLAPERVDALRGVSPTALHEDLRGLTNAAITAENARLTGKDANLTGPRTPQLGALVPDQLAQVLVALHTVVRLAPTAAANADADLDNLAIYDDDPASPHWGTYRTSTREIAEVVRDYQPGIGKKGLEEVLEILTTKAPRVTRGGDPDLVACRNGIVDYNGGDPEFIEFSPEYVFVAKLAVDWNPDAVNPVIHNDDDGTDWDVESWMRGFYTTSNPFTGGVAVDEAMSELLWEVIGAVTRPYNSWHRCAFLYSAQGNNGKGTLLSLMRNMLGEGNYASIPLADFGKEFLLEPLTRASAILVDENDVGTFVERGGAFKAVVTNDVITINRKHRDPIAHQHFGFMVQCLNDPPVFKDKSESVYRRQLFIPFIKSFTGAERQYIKNDYLKRPEVLEYVLKRVLTGSLTEPYYELSEPDLVKAALNEFKSTNDPVRAFWEEISNELVWDLNPFTFIYDLYKAWMARYMPNSKAIGRNKFITELVALIRADETSQWECEDQTAPHRPSSLMSAPEPLIAEYNLSEWGNPTVPLSDPNYRDRRSTIPGDRMRQTYRGITRKADPTAPTPANAAGTIAANDTPAESAPAPVAKPRRAKSRTAPEPLSEDFGVLLNSPYDLDTDALGQPLRPVGDTTDLGGDAA